MKKILLATDGSDYSLQALQKAVPLARALEAEVTVISVAEELPLIRGTEGLSKGESDALADSINRETKAGLERARALFAGEGVRVSTLQRVGKPAEEIIEEAERGSYDLLILGDTGREGLKELFLGSVSNKVVHQARTDVLIIKR